MSMKSERIEQYVFSVAQPYEQMTYPGERVQIDLNTSCLVGEAPELYQYTAIDKMLLLRYVEGFEEISTYSSAVFLQNAK